MITVAGEALMDIVRDGADEVAHPGGTALNVARTIARLGGECSFLGRVSGDAFGTLVSSALREDGVGIIVPEPTPQPSTLAVAHLAGDGTAEYTFSLSGTSAFQLSAEDLPPGLAAGIDALVLGGLALLMEPIASTLTGLLADLPHDSLVVLDPNCRATATQDAGAHRRAIGAICERADLVKVSVDDLTLLAPGVETGQAARELLAGSARVVLVTDGGAPVRVLWSKRELRVPVPGVQVRDTVGAGDALTGAFTLWWRSRSLAAADLDDSELLGSAVTAAAQVAALTCMRAGAQPPRIPGWPDTPALARERIASAERLEG